MASDDGDGVKAIFTLDEGETVDLILEWNGEVHPLVHGEADQLFLQTSGFWQRWVGQSRYRGRWREAVERSEETRRRAGSSLQISVPGPVIGRWDRMRIEQVVSNLLTNAIKYGEGKPIEIALEKSGDAAHLKIRDFGIGIPPDEQHEWRQATRRRAWLGRSAPDRAPATANRSAQCPDTSSRSGRRG